MTLGSCKDDDDDPEPTPAPVPVDTTPQKVTFPDEYKFRINNSTPVAFNAGDSIKANTLLSNGANSDTVSIDVILRNNTMVDPTSVSLSLANSYLGSVKVSNTPSITDSIYSISLPAIEGNYSLTINGKTRNFVVASTGKKLSVISRDLSNSFYVTLNKTNAKASEFEFSPYTETEDGAMYAKLSGSGKFVALEETDYNNYVASNKAIFEGEMKDVAAENWKASINGSIYFAYMSAEDKVYLGKIVSFTGASLREASEIVVAINF